MATLEEIRQQYPQYNDLSDRELAGKLHERFYSDMPKEDFDRRVGLAPQTWGEYAGGLARQAAQGATFGFADEIEAGARRLAGADYGKTVERIRRENEQFARENPIASVGANLAGGIVPFVGPVGAATRLGQAARWAASGSTLPRTIGRSAALGAGVGAGAGAGAGEGMPDERVGSAINGAMFGGALGAAAPPVIAGLGRVASAAAPVVERLMPRRNAEPPLPFNSRQQPIEGARFTADGISPPAPPAPPPAGEIADAQTRALQTVRDWLLRSGRTPDDVESMLARLQEARRVHTSGVGQDAIALADLDPSLQRLLGVMARQSPEAARDIVHFLTARQTGVTPLGADAGALAARGVPTRQRFAEPITGAQAQRTLGTAFEAGEKNTVPMGHRARVLDMLKRTLRIKDSDFHGHAADAGRTQEQLSAAMKAGAQKLYGATYKAGEAVDLRPAIAPVIEQAEALAANAQPPLSDALRGAARLFRTKSGEIVSDIRNFDLYGKQYLDDAISKAFKSGDTAVGRELRAFRDQLFAALDNATDANIKRVGTLYRTARGQYSDDMRVQEIIERYRNAWQGDPRALLDDFATLSPAEKKLARLSILSGAERKTGTAGDNRNIMGMFKTPDANRLIAGIVERSQKGNGRFANRPERFGQYLEFEGMMPETRNVATGNSMTAMRVQDDLMQVASDASQNVGRFLEMFRGNQSLYQLGERLMTFVYDRAFGVGADAAREAVRMLLTANPAERSEVLRQLAAIMPPHRIARFNDMVQRAQQYAVSGGANAGAGLAAPPAQPQLPTFL